MSGLFDSLLTTPSWVVLLVVGLVVFAEDAIFVGFVLPGETVAVLGGVAARLGNVPLWAVLTVVVVAAIVGDSVGYEIGKHVGPRVLGSRLFNSRRVQLEAAQRFLARRGGAAVFLGRWIAFFRAVMPALAGSARMPYRRFLAFNAAGGIAWGVVVVMLGFLAGDAYKKVEKSFGTGTAIVIGVLVVGALIVWQVRKHRSEREPSPSSTRSPDEPAVG